MLDIWKMMDKVKKVQHKMKEAQGQLSHIHTVGESGGGLVKATANGKKELISLEIDESLASDMDMMRALIIAAANKALNEAGEKAQVHIKKSTEGMLPNIPGLDPSIFR